MVRVGLLLVCLWSLCVGPAHTQGFAGLGTSADGFAAPTPDPVFVFPADHGPHPAFRIEWWYLTAVLEGEDGTPYGVQWTLFRNALEPHDGEGWQTPQLWMGHAVVPAVTDAESLSTGRERDCTTWGNSVST